MKWKGSIRCVEIFLQINIWKTSGIHLHLPAFNLIHLNKVLKILKVSTLWEKLHICNRFCHFTSLMMRQKKITFSLNWMMILLCPLIGSSGSVRAVWTGSKEPPEINRGCSPHHSGQTCCHQQHPGASGSDSPPWGISFFLYCSP